MSRPLLRPTAGRPPLEPLPLTPEQIEFRQQMRQRAQQARLMPRATGYTPLVESYRTAVLDVLRSGPKRRKQIAEATGMPYMQVGWALKTLHRDGKIRWSGVQTNVLWELVP